MHIRQRALAAYIATIVFIIVVVKKSQDNWLKKTSTVAGPAIYINTIATDT